MMYSLQKKGLVCFRYRLLFGARRITLYTQPRIQLRESSMSILRRLVCAAVILVMTAVPYCDAQVLYGSLTGNVTDPASAAIPAVHIEATNQETGVKSATNTDERGIYRFTNLQPGIYKVTVTAPSFRPYSA